MTIQHIGPDQRQDTPIFKRSRHSGNPHCMNLILDFVQAEFGLLPVESPGWSLEFLPPFAVILSAAVWDTSVWVSLHGKAHQFDGRDTVPGKNPNWRKFNVRNRSEDITRIKRLLRQAHANYRRDQSHLGWDEIIHVTEARWIENRQRELREAKRQQILWDL